MIGVRPIDASASLPERPKGELGAALRRNVDLIVTLCAPPVVLAVLFAVTGISAPVGLVVASLVLFVSSYGIVSYVRQGPVATKDRLARVAVWIGSSLALLPLASILFVVLKNGLSVLAADFPHFLVADLAHAGPSDPVTKAGVANAIVGTLEQCGLATLITVPVSVLTALFLDEASRPDPSPTGRLWRSLAGVIRMVVDAMNGIPSIITALFMYLVWVQPHGVHGYSGAAAAVALSIMMVPTVTRSSEEVLRIVPGSLREASLALGAPQWRTMLKVVVPTARAGLISGIILGIARGVGETAPTLFTAGGAPTMNVNPFSGRQMNLALDIYELIISPAHNAIREAWGASVVLIALVGGRLVGSRRAGRRTRRRVVRTQRALHRSDPGGT